MTKEIAEVIAAWYLENVKPAELDKKVEATLEYVKRFNSPEDGEWRVWAYEVVSGQHGAFTIRLFLDDIMGMDYYMNIEDPDALMGDFDDVSRALAREFNEGSKLPGTFYVGHNEADGSLGVFYSVKA